MDICWIAQLKDKKAFYSNYQKGDSTKLFNGRSLVFFALANTNLETRYELVNFLLDEGADALSINADKETLLHILLSRTNHDLSATTNLCSRLIKSGVDINSIDNRNRLALQYLVNMKYTDDELEPLYEMWFAQPHICVNIKNDWGRSPLDIARLMPYRKKLVERLEKYE